MYVCVCLCASVKTLIEQTRRTSMVNSVQRPFVFLIYICDIRYAKTYPVFFSSLSFYDNIILCAKAVSPVVTEAIHFITNQCDGSGGGVTRWGVICTVALRND